jgi:hypothetical protein
MHYREERPADGQTVEHKRACRVEGEEVVTVPAGEFKTMKVTCTDMATNQLTSEFWYAPSVKNRVMERSHFSYGVRQRELTGYRVE